MLPNPFLANCFQLCALSLDVFGCLWPHRIASDGAATGQPQMHPPGSNETDRLASDQDHDDHGIPIR